MAHFIPFQFQRPTALAYMNIPRIIMPATSATMGNSLVSVPAIATSSAVKCIQIFFMLFLQSRPLQIARPMEFPFTINLHPLRALDEN